MPRGVPKKRAEMPADQFRYDEALKRVARLHVLRRVVEQAIGDASEEAHQLGPLAGASADDLARDLRAASRGIGDWSDGPMIDAALRATDSFSKLQRPHRKLTGEDLRTLPPEEIETLLGRLDAATEAIAVSTALRARLARHLADRGHSTRSLAKSVGPTYTSVATWVEQERAAGPDTLTGGDDDTLAELIGADDDVRGQERARRYLLVALLDAGVTGRQLARRLGVTNHTVAKWARAARVEQAEAQSL